MAGHGASEGARLVAAGHPGQRHSARHRASGRIFLGRLAGPGLLVPVGRPDARSRPGRDRLHRVYYHLLWVAPVAARIPVLLAAVPRSHFFQAQSWKKPKAYRRQYNPENAIEDLRILLSESFFSR